MTCHGIFSHPNGIVRDAFGWICCLFGERRHWCKIHRFSIVSKKHPQKNFAQRKKAAHKEDRKGAHWELAMDRTVVPKIIVCFHMSNDAGRRLASFIHSFFSPQLHTGPPSMYSAWHTGRNIISIDEAAATVRTRVRTRVRTECEYCSSMLRTRYLQQNLTPKVQQLD